MRAAGWRYGGGVAALILLTHCGGTGGDGVVPETADAAPGVLERSAATVLRFEATADARVEAANPQGRYGGETTLSVDASPQRESSLRFDVEGVLPASVTRAVLRLYALDGTNNGPRVHATNPYFAELAIDWYNRSTPQGPVLADAGAIASGTWVEFDVTSAVKANGTFGFMLSPDSSDGVDFASRETGRADRRPQLLVTVDPAAGCLPRTDTQTLRVVASHDGYASQAEPTRRFGAAPSLRVGDSPRLEAFLRFGGYVVPPYWTQRGAQLRLFIEDGTRTTPQLYHALSNWPMDPVLGLDFDWNTRPPIVGPVIGGGASIAGTWQTDDVSDVVTSPSHPYAFGILPAPGSTDGAAYASANAADETHRPHLAIALESTPYCTYRGSGGGLTGWTKHSGGKGPEELRALATDAQGGFVAAGRIGDAPFPNGQGFALARYGADATPVWSRRITTDDVVASALTVTPEGNILVVGHYRGSPDLGTGPLPGTPTSSGLFLAKFSPGGQTVWTRGFLPTTGLSGDRFSYTPIYPEAVATDAQGSLVVTGNFFGQVDLGGGPLFAGAASIGLTDRYPGGFLARFTWQGQHVFSRVYEAAVAEPAALLRAVATDPAGNVLLGGRLSALAEMGGGYQGMPAPFVAKYGPTGTFLWKRSFPGVHGEVVAVRPLAGDRVAFTANLGGPFTFAGGRYRGGIPDEDGDRPENLSGFTGTLSQWGLDLWLRPLDTQWGRVGGLVTTSEGGVTVSGYAGLTFDLGGGALGPWHDGPPTAFVAHFSTTGAHRWSRALDAHFREPGALVPRLYLAPLPGDALLIGASFEDTVQVDGVTSVSRGGADLFFLRLRP